MHTWGWRPRGAASSAPHQAPAPSYNHHQLLTHCQQAPPAAAHLVVHEESVVELKGVVGCVVHQ